MANVPPGASSSERLYEWFAKLRYAAKLREAHSEPMPVLLVLTLGGSPRPILQSILAEPRPDRVLFICSTDSRKMLGEPSDAAPDSLLPSLRASGFPLTSGQYEVYTIRDPQDLTGAVRDIDRHITPEVTRWRSRDQAGTYTVAVDFTGGTKVMSVSLAYVARRWDCTFRYIGGTLRAKEGLGVVEDSHEMILASVNPLEALGYQVAEDALTLCREMDFRAAERLLEEASGRQRRPEVKRALQTLRQLVLALSHWDSFRHEDALRAFEGVEKNQSDLTLFLASTSVENIHSSIPRWRKTLVDLSVAKTSTFALVGDLLANALRRGQERRFDDAVARLYRAIEALAQAALATRHNIPGTDRIDAFAIPWNKLQPQEEQRWRASLQRNNTLKLALRDSYCLLQALDDPLGAAFFQSDFVDQKRSPLPVRNLSILAHGYAPTTEKDFDHFKRVVFQVAAVEGFSESSIFRFPVLERKGA